MLLEKTSPLVTFYVLLCQSWKILSLTREVKALQSAWLSHRIKVYCCLNLLNNLPLFNRYVWINVKCPWSMSYFFLIFHIKEKYKFLVRILAISVSFVRRLCINSSMFFCYFSLAFLAKIWIFIFSHFYFRFKYVNGFLKNFVRHLCACLMTTGPVHLCVKFKMEI